MALFKIQSPTVSKLVVKDLGLEKDLESVFLLIKQSYDLNK